MFLQQGGIPGFGGAMPENVQLPPEMAKPHLRDGNPTTEH
jgi:hypothetical protein